MDEYSLRKFIKKDNIRKIVMVSIILFSLSLYLSISSLNKISASSSAAFKVKKGEVIKNTYDSFYDKGFMRAESIHHVSNKTSIIIGKLREEQKLEVLKVYDTSYQIYDEEKDGILSGIGKIIPRFNNKDINIWLEIPGSGIFTINLKASEFIVDDYHQYVLIRVPNPQLSEFSLEYDKKNILYFDDGGFNEKAGKGIKTDYKLSEKAYLELRESIINNQEFYNKAKANAEKILINLVRNLNPNLPNLEVEVEFYDLL